ncbi:hypothetical protein AB0E27_31270 [Streptomyces sparsogenes]|uniref:hypothetical protein n=1 Tax=Streptomyces sparsogenes TaxID=67365 RepID=UPI0033FE27A8
MHDINPELGAKLGLTKGDTVELVTDEWKEVVAARGDRGEVLRFHEDRDRGVIFTIVTFGEVDLGHGFPFDPSEIKKVEVGE